MSSKYLDFFITTIKAHCFVAQDYAHNGIVEATNGSFRQIWVRPTCLEFNDLHFLISLSSVEDTKAEFETDFEPSFGLLPQIKSESISQLTGIAIKLGGVLSENYNVEYTIETIKWLKGPPSMIESGEVFTGRDGEFVGYKNQMGHLDLFYYFISNIIITVIGNANKRLVSARGAG